MTEPFPTTKRAPRYWETSDFWKDALERVGTMFLVAFGALVLDDGFVLSWRSLGVATLAATVSTIKALVGASKKGTTTPVSLL